MNHKESQLVKQALKELEEAEKIDHDYRAQMTEMQRKKNPNIDRTYRQRENWRLSYVKRYLIRLLNGDTGGKGTKNPRVNAEDGL